MLTYVLHTYMYRIRSSWKTDTVGSVEIYFSRFIFVTCCEEFARIRYILSCVTNMYDHFWRILHEVQFISLLKSHFRVHHITYEGHFRSNINVPVTSLCMIQLSKTIPHFVRLYMTYKMVKSETNMRALSLNMLVYIYGMYKYIGWKTD